MPIVQSLKKSHWNPYKELPRLAAQLVEPTKLVTTWCGFEFLFTKSRDLVLVPEGTFKTLTKYKQRDRIPSTNLILGFVLLSGTQEVTIAGVMVVPPFRKKGVGTKMYETLILDLNKTITCGWSQTPAAVKLWKSLMKNDKIQVFAEYLNEPPTLVTKWPKQHTDMRLIAKKKINSKKKK